MNNALWKRAAEVLGSDLGKKLKELTSTLPNVRLGAGEFLDELTNPSVLTAMEALAGLGIARKAERGIVVLDRTLIGRLEVELRPLVLPGATPAEIRAILSDDLEL